MHLHRPGYFCALLLTCLVGWAAPVRAVTVSSPAFAQGKPIPAKYAKEEQNVSPELRIKEVPAKAQSLVVIVDDPDAPVGLWTHWLVWNLPADTTSIPEGGLPDGELQGKNSFGHVRYDGPAPPPGPSHRYYFRVYALDLKLSLPAGADRAALMQAMEGHVVGKGETFGVYGYGPSLVPL